MMYTIIRVTRISCIYNQNDRNIVKTWWLRVVGKIVQTIFPIGVYNGCLPCLRVIVKVGISVSHFIHPSSVLVSYGCVCPPATGVRRVSAHPRSSNCVAHRMGSSVSCCIVNLDFCHFKSSSKFVCTLWLLYHTESSTETSLPHRWTFCLKKFLYSVVFIQSYCRKKIT